MSILVAIDPGSQQSGVVIVRESDAHVLHKAIMNNGDVIPNCISMVSGRNCQGNYEFVVEMPMSYGMPVGREVFQTMFWIGRFCEQLSNCGVVLRYLGRKAIVATLCGDSKGTDSNVRRGVIECYPATGGGSEPAVGTKKQPGPLYGISGDMWSALALAVVSLKRGSGSLKTCGDYGGEGDAVVEGVLSEIKEEFATVGLFTEEDFSEKV